MKALIESALAEVMLANLPALAASVPQHASAVLPDSGTSLIVLAETEHRGGNYYLANVTFRLETVASDDVSLSLSRAHGEFEAAVQIVARAVDALDCGLGVHLSGAPFFLEHGGGVDGNRWVSELKFRWGASGS